MTNENNENLTIEEELLRAAKNDDAETAVRILKEVSVDTLMELTGLFQKVTAGCEFAIAVRAMEALQREASNNPSFLQGDNPNRC